ncbi:MAG: PAS domain S-box protein [Deltaproteobacteria bacterium]|nr:PAS domain S-box protein [Deltaproteobacteria bacterium]MCB9479474.1 PAS domain S-box protein [Deltaproteobacteria bacterium]MCB9489643.1 PAS domain S-box protein [Deltaproteobacteria bacterium]
MPELAAAPSIGDLCRRALTILGELLEARGGSAYRVMDDHLCLQAGLDPGHQPETLPLNQLGSGLIGRLLRHREAFIVEDMARESAIEPSGWSGYADPSALVVPIHGETGDVACLCCLHNKAEPPFDEFDLEIARVVAAHAGVVLNTLQLRENLTASENRYRQLTEKSLTGIFIHDEGKVVYFNRRMAQMFGYGDISVEKLSGKSFLDVVHPDDREAIRDRWTRRIDGEDLPTHHLMRAFKRDGSEILLEVLATVIEHEGRRATMGHAIDVTERQRATQERDRLLRFQAEILNNPGMMIVVSDENSAITIWNAGAERITGYSADEVVGSSEIWRMLYPDAAYLDRVAKEFNASYAEGGTVQNKTSNIRHKDGTDRVVSWFSVRLAEDGSRRLGTISVGLDVTESRQYQEALVRSEEKYRNLVESSEIGIFIMDEGRFAFVNEAMCNMFGATPDQMIGKMAFDFLEGKDQQKMIDVFTEWSNDVEVDSGHRIEITGIGGVKRHIVLRVRDIVYDGRRAIHGLFTDVTKEKELEDKLLQSRKMEAIGRLAGGIAHDFNNMLTGIIGYAEMILTEGRVKPPDPLYEDVQEIKDAADRAAQLTRQLLAFSKQQLIEPRVIDLNKVIRDSMKMVSRMIGEHIRLDLDFSRDKAVVRVDPTQVDQILVNLAANARDAMPGGGSFRITTRVIEDKERPSPGRDDVVVHRFVEMTVADTGCGMDPETLARSFEPFYSTKDKDKGTGLGLATVYGIVQQHDSTIEVDSRVGEGTVFRLYFPYVDGQPAPVDVDDTADMGHKGTERILLVEDQDIVRALAKRILRRQGYEVFEASNGPEALEIADRLDHPVELLLTDVVMPGMNGLELYKQMHARDGDLKVLYMSGHEEELLAHQGVLNASTPFLYKPFKIRSLAAKVREVLDDVARSAPDLS